MSRLLVPSALAVQAEASAPTMPRVGFARALALRLCQALREIAPGAAASAAAAAAGAGGAGGRSVDVSATLRSGASAAAALGSSRRRDTMTAAFVEAAVRH
jgi:hypothetical protein